MLSRTAMGNMWSLVHWGFFRCSNHLSWNSLLLCFIHNPTVCTDYECYSVPRMPEHSYLADELPVVRATSVDLTCEPGYIVTGNITIQTLTCIKFRIWHPIAFLPCIRKFFKSFFITMLQLNQSWLYPTLTGPPSQPLLPSSSHHWNHQQLILAWSMVLWIDLWCCDLTDATYIIHMWLAQTMRYIQSLSWSHQQQ